MEVLEEIPNTLRTYEEMYDDLIRLGVDSFQYCLDRSDSQWKRLELDWMEEYFIEKEDYKKCSVIRDVKKDHYLAPGDVQDRLTDQWIEKLLETYSNSLKHTKC